MAFIDEAKSLILDYYAREFGERNDQCEFTDLNDVGLAYTHYYIADTFTAKIMRQYNVTPEETSIPYDHQVSVNLNNKTVTAFINGHVIFRVPCTEKTLLELLRDISFNDLIWIPAELNEQIIRAIRRNAV